MTAAGPASDEAYRAPNNQPAPMIDPKDAKRSPSKPISRRSFRAVRSGVAANGGASSAVAGPLPMWPPGDLLGDGPDHGPSPRVSQPLRRLCDKPAAGAFRPLGQLGFCGDAAKYPTRETQDVKFGARDSSSASSSSTSEVRLSSSTSSPALRINRGSRPRRPLRRFFATHGKCWLPYASPASRAARERRLPST